MLASNTTTADVGVKKERNRLWYMTKWREKDVPWLTIGCAAKLQVALSTRDLLKHHIPSPSNISTARWVTEPFIQCNAWTFNINVLLSIEISIETLINVCVYVRKCISVHSCIYTHTHTHVQPKQLKGADVSRVARLGLLSWLRRDASISAREADRRRIWPRPHEPLVILLSHSSY